MKKRISRLILFVMVVNLILPQAIFADRYYKDQEEISSWAVDKVLTATDKGFLSGDSGYFKPSNNINRAEFTKLMVEVFDLQGVGGSREFTDVNKGDWFYDYVMIGVSNNIIQGFDGKFNPYGKISREEMAVIISRALGLDGQVNSDFKDFKDISSWAIEDVNRVANLNIIMGSEGRFRPKDKSTREMAAVVSMRAYDYNLENNPDKPSLEIDQEEIGRRLDRAVGYIGNEVKQPLVSSVGGEWSVIGLNRSNRPIDSGFNQFYLDELIENLDNKNGQLHLTRYTEYSRAILALRSIGEDPKNVGGYNLEEKIRDIDKVKKQGINGPIFALIALNTIDDNPTLDKKAMVDYILEREIASGGWALSSEIDQGDVDVTAMVIQALSAFKTDEKVSQAIDRGVDFLSREQDQDGGYLSWGSKNSENASQVVIALTSLGIDPHKDERFIKNGNSLIEFLLKYQDRNGGFKHELRSTTNLMASEQGLLALVSYERMLNGDRGLYDMLER